MGLFVVAVLVAAVAVALIQRRGVFLVQYLFFLRYPLGFAAALVAGPLLAVTAGRSLVGNLFVLRPFGVSIVTALAFFVASTVVYTFNLIFALTPARTKLPLLRTRGATADAGADVKADAKANLARQAAWAEAMGRWHFLIAVGLVAPLAMVLTARAATPWWQALLAAAGGVAAAALAARAATREIAQSGRDTVTTAWAALQAAEKLLEKRLGKLPFARPQWVRRAVDWLLETFDDGFAATVGERASGHARALVFFLLSVILYAVGFFVLGYSFRSQERLLADAIPALAYLLVLLMVFGWLLPFLAFYFDKFRVPPALALLLAWTASYTFFAKDHYFTLSQLSAPPGGAAAAGGDCSLTPGDAAAAWAARNGAASGRKPTMVVVAASGGGITASLWTARVLTALASPTEGLGPAFARDVALISTASGGGLGAAYFVDAYRPEGPERWDDADRERIVSSAGASSLHDTAFALAYSDLFRLLLPVLVNADSPDRGQALEHSWARRLSEPQITIGGWRAGVREGWRPTQIFNVTIAETGERLLLGPIDCPTSACAPPNTARWRGESLADLYGACDLPVVTAARLSATFPWVTPLARAPLGYKGYHLADGGYYDNFGIVTAIEWLSSVHAKRDLRTLVDKVLVLQIRAAEDQQAQPGADRGWIYATVGPLLTLLNVRTTSQRNHNDAELLGLKAVLALQGVRLETVELELAIETPLSWHLTDAEKERINAQWTAHPKIKEKRQLLACLWREQPDDWHERCGTEKPIDVKSPQAPSEVFKQVQNNAAEPVIVPVPVPVAGAAP